MLSEIKVTFSKKMQDKNWSFAIHSKDSFPKLAGDPQFTPDGRTCVLPVKLESQKTYALWINSQKFNNFKDTKGNSAMPYLLTFKTK